MSTKKGVGAAPSDHLQMTTTGQMGTRIMAAAMLVKQLIATDGI